MTYFSRPTSITATTIQSNSVNTREQGLYVALGLHLSKLCAELGVQKRHAP